MPISLPTIIAQIVSFIVFLLLLRRFALPLLIRPMEQRRQHIETTIRSAEQDLEEARRLRAEIEEGRRMGRAEAQELLDRAQRTAEHQAGEIVATAKREATGLVEAARAEIAAEKQEAITELRQYVVELSLSIAGKVLEREIQQADQEKLLSEFLSEAGR